MMMTEKFRMSEDTARLMAVNREVLVQADMPTRTNRIVLDMDSSESPVHGAGAGSGRTRNV